MWEAERKCQKRQSEDEAGCVKETREVYSAGLGNEVAATSSNTGAYRSWKCKN